MLSKYRQLTKDGKVNQSEYSRVVDGAAVLFSETEYAINNFMPSVLGSTNGSDAGQVAFTTGTVTLSVQLHRNGRWIDLVGGTFNAVDADTFSGEFSGKFYAIRAICEGLDVPYVTVRLITDN